MAKKTTRKATKKVVKKTTKEVVKKTIPKKRRILVVSKKTFWISVLVLFLVSAFVIILANLGYEKEIQKEFEEMGLGDFKSYYDDLSASCESMSIVQKGCCIESANLMMRWKYFEAVEGNCPEGYEVNTLKNCIGSYSWCE